jgi:hypothetical protein
MTEFHKGVGLYVGLSEGGGSDVGTLKLDGYTLIADVDLKRLIELTPHVEACLKVCDGIPTVTLQSLPRTISTLRYQRDEVMHAATELLQALQQTNWSSWQTLATFEGPLAKLDRVLSNLKGEQP